ncbi:MAG: HPP family protein [Sulfuritalea sp.]|nr:HPP family protein [Sulfuritalea sp.]
MNSRDLATQSLWQKLLGIELSPVRHREWLVSALGAFVGILVVFQLGRGVLGVGPSPVMVLSMGSTAAMLFAVPHGALSQPWPIFGGHLASGLIGIACLLYVPDALLAASLAVGLAVGAMHYLRCVHPPAGATALAAALGGESVRAMGFGFVVAPLMFNVLIMLAVAVAFNFPFPWRRYPVILARRPPRPAVEPIAHEDFVFALSQLDSFIDVSEEDLLRIYGLATGRHGEVAARAVKAARTINPVAPP